MSDPRYSRLEHRSVHDGFHELPADGVAGAVGDMASAMKSLQAGIEAERERLQPKKFVPTEAHQDMLKVAKAVFEESQRELAEALEDVMADMDTFAAAVEERIDSALAGQAKALSADMSAAAARVADKTVAEAQAKMGSDLERFKTALAEQAQRQAGERAESLKGTHGRMTAMERRLAAEVAELREELRRAKDDGQRERIDILRQCQLLIQNTLASIPRPVINMEAPVVQVPAESIKLLMPDRVTTKEIEYDAMSRPVKVKSLETAAPDESWHKSEPTPQIEEIENA